MIDLPERTQDDTTVFTMFMVHCVIHKSDGSYLLLMIENILIVSNRTCYDLCLFCLTYCFMLQKACLAGTVLGREQYQVAS